MTKWLILRTASRNTLKLAEQLMREGFDAWTPRTVVKKKARRGSTDRYQITAPMLPSYAFARAEHITALLAKANDPVKSCPDFSIFHRSNGIPLIDDVEIEKMRWWEERDRRKSMRRKTRQDRYEEGSTVKITVGAFAGMSGEVKADDGKFVTLLFGTKEVKFSTFVLTGDEVVCPSNVTAKAA